MYIGSLEYIGSECVFASFLFLVFDANDYAKLWVDGLVAVRSTRRLVISMLSVIQSRTWNSICCYHGDNLDTDIPGA